jgi:hypothetical protein
MAGRRGPTRAPAAAARRHVGSDPLVAPTIDTISASYGSDPNPRLALNVTGPDRADLVLAAAMASDQGTTLWNVEAVDDGDVHPSPVLISGFVPPTPSLEVQVRYITGGGNVSTLVRHLNGRHLGGLPDLGFDHDHPGFDVLRTWTPSHEFR